MTDLTLPSATLLSSVQLDGVAFEPFAHLEGISRKVLWREGSAEAGILRIAGGAHLGVHAHRVSHHHMWVLEGAADILGARLSPGSYAHIPHGVEHDVDASATDGCTLLYVYSPEG